MKLGKGDNHVMDYEDEVNVIEEGIPIIDGLKVFESGTLEGNIMNGQIRYCKLQGGNGNLNKTRPCIIVQNDIYNKDCRYRVYVVPLSSHEENINSCDYDYRLAVRMQYENKSESVSYVCLDKGIWLSRCYIGALMGNAPKELMVKISEFMYLRIIKQNIESEDIENGQLKENDTNC